MLKKRLVLEIDLEIDVDGEAELAKDATLRPYIQIGLNECNAGRYWFSTELIRDGVERLLNGCIHHAVYQEADEAHPATASGGNPKATEQGRVTLGRMRRVRVAPKMRVVALQKIPQERGAKR